MVSIAERIKFEVINNQEIMEIDYSDCNEEVMVELLTLARATIRNRNKPHRVLAIFNSKSFLTPRVMEVFNSDRLDPSLLERQATIGVSTVKTSIIKGHNVLENNTIKIFESKAEAIKYLTT